MILLDIAVFATSDADWRLGLEAYVEAANYHLANYDMRLNPYPATQPISPIVLPLFGAVHDPPPDGAPLAMRPGDVRAACHVALPQGHGIPVIFSKFSHSPAGMTIYTEDAAANRGIQWLNYVLIRESWLNADCGALLHELIHAADYNGDNPLSVWGSRTLHDLDPGSIMRPDPIPGVPVVMQDRHARALRGAYFARHT